MKQRIITSILGLFAVAVSFNNSYAQRTVMLQPNSFITKTKINYNNGLASIPGTGALLLNEISTKAIRTFGKSFKDVTNLVWYGVDSKKYLAIFTSKDGRYSRALFAKNGYMYYGIRYGNEQSLADEQRRVIKSKYVEYTIDQVYEISADGQKVWVIDLQDDDNVVVVRLTAEGILDELLNYQKCLPVKNQRKRH